MLVKGKYTLMPETLLRDLVLPHQLSNVFTASLKALNKLGEGIVNINRNRSGCDIRERLLEMGRNLHNQRHQIADSKGDLVSDAARDREQFRATHEVV